MRVEGERSSSGRAGRSTSPGRLARIARTVASGPILVYQRAISPALPRRCRYEPTCSRYAVQAISEYGILRGSVLAIWRLLRCNPWSRGGYDPVSNQGLFACGSEARHRG